MSGTKPSAGARFFGKFIGKTVRGISGAKLAKAPPEEPADIKNKNYQMQLEAYQRALQTGDKRRMRGIRSAGIIVHAEKVAPGWRQGQSLENKSIGGIDDLARLAYDNLVDADTNAIHIVYMKDNKILSKISFPKNYPLSSPKNMTSLEDSVMTNLNDAKVEGADGYYAIQNNPDNKIDTNTTQMHQNIASKLPGYLGGLLIAPGFQYGHIRMNNNQAHIEEKQLPLPDPGQEFVSGYDGPYTVLNNHQELLDEPTVEDDKPLNKSDKNISKISQTIERARDTTLLIYSKNDKTVGIQEIPNKLFKQSNKFNDYTKNQMNKYAADEVVAVVDKSKIHGSKLTLQRTMKKKSFNFKLAEMDTETMKTTLLNIDEVLTG